MNFAGVTFSTVNNFQKQENQQIKNKQEEKEISYLSKEKVLDKFVKSTKKENDGVDSSIVNDEDKSADELYEEIQALKNDKIKQQNIINNNEKQIDKLIKEVKEKIEVATKKQEEIKENREEKVNSAVKELLNNFFNKNKSNNETKTTSDLNKDIQNIFSQYSADFSQPSSLLKEAQRETGDISKAIELLRNNTNQFNLIQNDLFKKEAVYNQKITPENNDVDTNIENIKEIQADENVDEKSLISSFKVKTSAEKVNGYNNKSNGLTLSSTSFFNTNKIDNYTTKADELRDDVQGKSEEINTIKADLKEFDEVISSDAISKAENFFAQIRKEEEGNKKQIA